MKVSVCIPAYMQPVFLQRTLQSVFSQSFTDYEVIVTDDSPDDSVEKVIGEFRYDARLRYYKNKETKGSPENWNEAIRYASGEYIKILHHDDWFLDSESLFKYVELLDRNPTADFAFSATVVSSVKGSAKIHSTNNKKIRQLATDPTTLFFGNTIGAPSATIYRKSANLEFDTKLKWFVDLDFYIRLLKRNNSFAYSLTPLICTTDEAPHQVTNECQNNKNLLLFEYTRLYTKTFGDRNPDAREFRLFWKLFRRFKVNTADEIYLAGVSGPLPPVILKVLRLRKALRWFQL